MKKCPACSKYTMDFDSYFGRFRCFNPECHWMAPTSTERQLKLIECKDQPMKLKELFLQELGCTLVSTYEPVNDALVFDFGRDEPSFDVPEPNGIMIWRIGHRSRTVTGFVIVGIRKLGIHRVELDIQLRARHLGQRVKELFAQAQSQRPQMMVGRIDASSMIRPERNTKNDLLTAAVEDAISCLKATCPA